MYSAKEKFSIRPEIQLVLYIVFCIGLGSLSGILGAGMSDSTWFREIEKPFFQPPNWLFGPVWTILYFMMGTAWWRFNQFSIAKFDRLLGNGLFIFQLFLNFTWTPLFFRLQSPTAALINIIALDIVVLFTIMVFRKTESLTSILLLPYFLWILFATILNFSIVILNL